MKEITPVELPESPYKTVKTSQLTCGIIMPISPMENCTADHWQEIRALLKDVATEAGFKTEIVSQADETNVIQRTIVQNVFKSDVIICDVSCKNPNVMFELGMRLAFDKATVIIKDDVTGYSFDTGILEHLEYPRDLRLGKMLRFKEDLAKKLESTYKKSLAENYSMFLHNFGTFKVATLDEVSVSKDEYLVKSLEEIKSQINLLKRQVLPQHTSGMSDTARAALREANQTAFLEAYTNKFLEENNIESINGYFEPFYRYMLENKMFRNLFETKGEAVEFLDKKFLH
ncbi:hypothetical protein [Chryseobacterium foetidum]|uniref:hypothetical protein n=1 Tax=Chryseobacterium foetidum TaxID=2951057 RepID=UPI0021CA4783|nr:hypothetical protein [Chryseobacterium foetidum]